MTTSIKEKKCGLIIVDDYNRWTWVKFLRSKDESYKVFNIFYKQVQSGKELIKVRSGHDGEFENKPFEIFCNRLGIIHKLFFSRTPHQNGVVERKNKSLQ